MIPYSADVYFGALAEHNRSIWPAQIVALLLGCAAIFLTVRTVRHSGRIAALVLAAAWIWCGAVYHLGTFTALNFWDYPIGALFLAQGLLILWYGVVRNGFDAGGGTQRVVGVAIMAYALAGHPLIGLAFGRSVEQLTLYGTTPVPTILFALGALSAWSVAGQFWLWSFVSLLAAVYLVQASILPVPEDWSLALAMIVLATAGLIGSRTDQ